MSRKAANFAGYIVAPANLHNFKISFLLNRDADNIVSVTAQSATMPEEPLQEVRLQCHGENVIYPTRPSNGGDWTVTMPESDRAVITKLFEGMKAGYNQVSGQMAPRLWDKVTVEALDMEDIPYKGKILHGVWLKRMSDVTFNSNSANANMTLTATFTYNWLEDIPTSHYEKGAKWAQGDVQGDGNLRPDNLYISKNGGSFGEGSDNTLPGERGESSRSTGATRG